MKDNSHEPPQVAIKFANLLLVLGVLFFGSLVIFSIFRFYNPTDDAIIKFSKDELLRYYLRLIFIGVIGLIFFGFGLRLKIDLKVNFSVILVTTVITVYVFETYLGFFREKINLRSIKAKQIGVYYDTRTKIEVLNSLTDFGVKAFPNVIPGAHLTDSGFIYNFGGISNITTILWNESGYYPIIKTDEHGFNNPRGLYNENTVDIVLSGDSFTEGLSVNSNESIGAVLREAGYRTISIGKNGNGPLKEFAALKEYAEPLKPKIVLWVYYENDMYDLMGELKSPFLRKYLNKDGFSQNLISRQEEIDSVLIKYVQRERVRERKKKLVDVIKLSKLRNLIHLVPKTKPKPKPKPTPITIFKDILQQSKQMVSEWGGEIYFVYLPSFYSQLLPVQSDHLPGNHYSLSEWNRKIVMQTATELDISIIDIQNEVFKTHPDPLSLFPFRMHSHYNAEGYRLVAEVIRKQLAADHYISIN
jgi:hypothetical protein